MLSKNGAKVIQVREANGVRDLGYSQLGFHEQLGGALQSQGANKKVWAAAGGTEFTEQLSPTYRQPAGHYFKVEIQIRHILIDAHDGCLELFNGNYYLYGTRYGNTDGFGKFNRYVCYSSPDLVTWTPHGEILKDAPPRTYYRPYVKYNRSTGRYVMWHNAYRS